MTFKSRDIEAGFHKLDYRLKVILVAVDVRRNFLKLPEVKVTSTIRADGVHLTGRAADVGLNELTEEQYREEEEWINWQFPRSDGYKTAFYHRNLDPKTRKELPGYHGHIQVAGMADTIYKRLLDEVTLRRE